MLAKSYLKDDFFFLLLRKLRKALWYICVILVFWEADAGRFEFDASLGKLYNENLS